MKRQKDQRAQSHFHLCARCNKRFECENPLDAEFEFAVCAECQERDDKENSYLESDHES